MSSNTKLAKELLRALEQRQKRQTTAIDTLAEVKRVEGDTIWVHVPGGPDETPIRKTISAKPGDKVQIRIAGGRGWASGNETSPPTDDSVAIAANRRAAVAGYIAGVADRKAEEARITARSKAKTFQTSDNNHPEPPYYAGDMWILTYMNEGERKMFDVALNAAMPNLTKGVNYVLSQMDLDAFVDEETAEQIEGMHPDAVLLAGEFSFTFMLADKLLTDGVRVVCSCSGRRTTETRKPDGTVEKTAVFAFEGFRDYAYYEGR